VGRVPDSLDELHLIEPVNRTWDRIARLLPRHQLDPSLRDRILRDAVTTAALKEADVVEYHWQELATALLPGARKLAPTARHVVFLHDVSSQSVRRAAATKTGLKALRARVKIRAVEIDEAMIVSLADAIIVLSNKDRDLLPDQSKVIVQRPVVRVKPQVRQRRTSGHAPIFLFVAAFNRPENLEAALWLYSEVWPRIRAVIPDAKLRFVGAQSDRMLADLVDPALEVATTGYVADLDGEYKSADVAVIPIHRGAGVKLKTLEAMVTATPSVSTSIGAEGIERAADFIEIADEPAQFAEAALRLASDRTGVYALRAAEGARWTMDAHSEEQCRVALTRAITGR
jgi:glycosyltransferase involved in cell wall biosynthesis